MPVDHERYVTALVRKSGGFGGIHEKIVQQNNEGEYLVVPRKAFELRDKRLHEIENMQRWAASGRTVGGPPLLVQLATAHRHLIDGVMGSFVTTMRATIDPLNTASDYSEEEE